MRFQISVLVAAIVIIVSCAEQHDAASRPGTVWYGDSIAFQDTVSKWKAYAESSDDGLWESDCTHSVNFQWVAILGGEEDIEPPFFTADYFSVSGDSVFVSDGAGQRLICMKLDGTVCWRAGELGEGPGYFLDIGRSDVSDQFVAVCNNGGCSVDIYSRAGEFVRRLSPISSPQDVKFLSDSTLLVFSKSEVGGDVHLVNAETGSIIESFGEGEWTIVAGNRAARDLSGIISSDSRRVAYISQFENKLLIYDINSHELIYRGARQLPTGTHGPTEMVEDDDGTRRGLLFPVPGVVFIGPEGMININLPRFMFDGQLLHDAGPYDYAPVTVVDRYNWEGEYLDSYCVPDSALINLYYSPESGMVGQDMWLEAIHCFTLSDSTVN